MARTHARILTAIWDDEEFLALSARAQRMYFVLLSQPDGGHAGILSTTVRRWALLAKGETEDDVRAALAELAATRFIVIDERTEELLIRSLIRNDGVYKQPKVLAVAIEEAARARSPIIRMWVARELAKIDTTELPDKTRPDVEALLEALPARLTDAHREPGAKAQADPPPHPPADPPAQAPAEGGAEGSAHTRARSPAPTPTPAIPPPAARAARRPGARPPALDPALEPVLTPAQRSKPITDAYAAVEPMCRWPAINGVVIKAIQSGKYTDDQIEAGLLRLAAEGRTVTVETLRTELDGIPPRGGNGRRTTDDRVRGHLAAGHEAQAILDAAGGR